MHMSSQEIPDAGPLEWPRNPFPGLRPFREDECLIFYGRNSQKDEVLARLNQSQLVFVTGPSGCGKSSLIKAGVLPALRAGLLTKAGYRWKILQMRPGRHPLARLAAEFDAELPARTAGSESGHELERLIKTEESALWLAADSVAPISRIYDARAPMRLLLVIDQFEEIFGEQIQEPQDVGRFVRLLVRFAQRPHPNLFLIVTMRSDYLGQCANFEGLAECINRSQFLTPVLTEEEVSQAIARPAEDYNGEVEPPLVEKIIRDMRTGFAYHPDSLPLMQHALLWLWSNSWRRSGSSEPPRPPFGHTSPRTKLTLAMYQENGGIEGILDRHAEDVLNEAVGKSQEHRKIAQELFRRLSERDSEGRYRRSPTSADNLCRIAGCTLDELRQIIKPFEQPDVCFLEQRRSVNTGETLVDVSHESLIRQWHTAKDWADTEADKLRRVRDLVNAARSWEEKNHSPDFLKRRGELEVIQSRWNKESPNAHWARRYELADEVPRVEQYLRASSETDQEERTRVEREREEKAAEKSLRQRNRNMGIAAFLLFISIVVSVFSYMQKQTDREHRAEFFALMADEARKIYGPARGLLVALQGISEALPELPAMQRASYRALAQLREHRILKDEEKPAGPIQSVQFAPKSEPLLVTTSQDGWLRFWNADTGDVVDRYYAGGRFLTARWNPTGSELFVSARGEKSFFLAPCSKSRLREFFSACGSAASDDVKRTFNDDFGSGVFSPDGRLIVTGSSNTSTRLWEVAKIGEPRKDFKVIGSFSVAAAFSHDSKRLALGTSNGIRIYDVAQILAFPEANYVLASPEANYETLGGVPTSADGTTQLGGLRVVTSVAFHPTDPNKLLATYQDGIVQLWDIAKSESIPLRADGGWVLQGVFNHTGSWVATAHEDRAVRLWPLAALDSQRQVRPQPLRGHEAMIFAVAYNSDGTKIASGSSDGTARIWLQQTALAPTEVTSSEPISPTGEARISVGDGRFVLNYNNTQVALTAPPDPDQAAAAGSPQAKKPVIVPTLAAISPSRKDAVVVPAHGRPYLFNLKSGEYIVMLPGRPTGWRKIGFLRNPAPTADGTPDQIVGITEDGKQFRWPYFGNLAALQRFAANRIPYVGRDKRLEISKDVLCRIKGSRDSECASADESATE
jgi:WD40 repeat protein